MSTATTDSTEIILQKIKELPPLPLVVQKLVQIMDDDLSCADDVTKALSSDQALAGKVLRLVNSSFYGLSGKVSTISRAVVILGFSAVRNLATGLSVAKILGKSGEGDHRRRFWDHSIAAAAAAEVLARRTGFPDPEEAFIAGLLHDLGHLVLSVAVPDQFTAILAEGPADLVEREKARLGMAHTRAGQLLLKHWKLPSNLSDAVRFHHTPKVFTGKDDPLISLVALADIVASIHGEVYERSIGESDLRQLIEVTGLDVEQMSEILSDMDGRIEETRFFLKLATDDDLATAATRHAEGLRVAMICTDRTKAIWTQQILRHYVHEMVPMKTFFAAAGAGADDAADLVILDPASVNAEQLAKMKPVLNAYVDRVVLFGADRDETMHRTFGRVVPELPLAFSRSDLEEHAGA